MKFILNIQNVLMDSALQQYQQLQNAKSIQRTLLTKFPELLQIRSLLLFVAWSRYWEAQECPIGNQNYIAQERNYFHKLPTYNKIFDSSQLYPNPSKHCTKVPQHTWLVHFRNWSRQVTAFGSDLQRYYLGTLLQDKDASLDWGISGAIQTSLR